MPQASHMQTFARRLSAFRVMLLLFIAIRPQRGQGKKPPCCFSAKRSISVLASFSFIQMLLSLNGSFDAADDFLQGIQGIGKIVVGIVCLFVMLTVLHNF